jgi:hypothetical protein
LSCPWPTFIHLSMMVMITIQRSNLRSLASIMLTIEYVHPLVFLLHPHSVPTSMYSTSMLHPCPLNLGNAAATTYPQQTIPSSDISMRCHHLSLASAIASNVSICSLTHKEEIHSILVQTSKDRATHVVAALEAIFITADAFLPPKSATGAL